MIMTPGQVNIDMADIQSVMRNAGTAMMGTGSASGPNRAAEAARQAVQAPLLLQSVSHATGERQRGLLCLISLSCHALPLPPCVFSSTRRQQRHSCPVHAVLHRMTVLVSADSQPAAAVAAAAAATAGILYNVTGGPDLTLHEVMQVGEVINELADSSAQCIFGTVEDPK